MRVFFCTLGEKTAAFWLPMFEVGHLLPLLQWAKTSVSIPVAGIDSAADLAHVDDI